MIKQVRDRLDDKQFTGVIEAVNDKKRIGRVKVRVHQLHGRPGDKQFIETEDLPWASPTTDLTGGSFTVAGIGKVVNVIFVEGDIYRPVYSSALHLNYNLQEKLLSLTDEQYAEFYALAYDDKHQYYQDLKDGLMFDYVKSKFNIRPNGDMIMGLRDNKANLFLGSEDASEPAMLTARWLKFFDKLIGVLLGVKGGPYIGNLGADVIPAPALMDIVNEHYAIRDTFKSEHVFITDNQRVKPNERKFDKNISADLFNSESTYEKRPVSEAVGYVPAARSESASVPAGVAPDAFLNQIGTSKLPKNPLPIELAKLANPVGGSVANGLIPVSALGKSRYLAQSFGDERAFLLPDAAIEFDSLLDDYNRLRSSDMPDIIPMKGYQSILRQEAISKQFADAANRGEDPFGWGNQVELYWGLKVKPSDNVRIKAMLNDPKIEAKSGEEKTLRWLQKNAPLRGWYLAGRDANGDAQWWHWIYKQ